MSDTNLNIEEFKLFVKYNNREEKRSRHIDTYFFDSPNYTPEQVAEMNTKALERDSLEQIQNNTL